MSAVNADIICAQETRQLRNYLAEACGRLAGGVYEMAPHGKWGSAILSRCHSLTVLSIVHQFKDWVVDARVHDVETGEGRQHLDVYSVHIPSPGLYEQRALQWLEVYSRAPPDRPLIVARDFNITVAVRQEPETLGHTPGEC